MSKRRGLGKGLQALFPGADQAAAGATEQLKEIDIDKIRTASRQPRQLFDPEKLAELAESIRELGVIQPVVVRPEAGGGYELIAGERRWRACKSLGYKTIPAVVKDYRDLEATAVSLIENIQREDLNPLEEALAYHQLMEDFQLTQEEVSGRVGKSRPFVANMVRLLGLPDEVKEMLAAGQLSAGHARALLAIEDAKKQAAAAGKIVRQQLNVRQTENLAKALMAEKAAGEKKKRYKAMLLASAEEELQKFLKTPVKVRETRNGRGKLEITYGDPVELNRLVELITGRKKT
ncbi:putative chromosome-partitioning protein ParB [Pelotomaculum schinkii]|uniref:Putative chromosome-partitioning protein ParB n=1 Tax=Pelotomaculum schinkii TaxID=78350 RepID=A0A4Y7R562_9FIRM|nr:ParB/RepB/Spo0J family partition protein [Pelotomaculum schinkii]TEB04148.1 putative chromosome-partitioning protein ParB [Pelotomaculum schinkii]